MKERIFKVPIPMEVFEKNNQEFIKSKFLGQLLRRKDKQDIVVQLVEEGVVELEDIVSVVFIPDRNMDPGDMPNRILVFDAHLTGDGEHLIPDCFLEKLDLDESFEEDVLYPQPLRRYW